MQPLPDLAPEHPVLSSPLFIRWPAGCRGPSGELWGPGRRVNGCKEYRTVTWARNKPLLCWVTDLLELFVSAANITYPEQYTSIPCKNYTNASNYLFATFSMRIYMTIQMVKETANLELWDSESRSEERGLDSKGKTIVKKRLEHLCPLEPSAMMEMFYSVLSSMVATSHMWLLSTLM